MRAMVFGKYAASCMALGALAVSGCLDDLTEPHPVVQLRAADAPLAVEAGQSIEAAVQALDVQERGVNGAHIAFARGDAQHLFFDGAATRETDAITIVTASGLLAGVQADGVARVRIVADNEAAPGATSVLAVVLMPTADDDSAVSLRIDVTITEPPEPEPEPAPDAGAGATSGNSTGNGTDSGGTAS
jgi:hypothetical protein